MPQDSAAALERRHVRDRANQIQRAIAAVYLAVDALPPTDQVLTLNVALRETLDRLDRHPLTGSASPSDHATDSARSAR